MAKDDSKLQIQLKIDETKDREIFNVLKVTDNKSDFIKDALFHYVYLIEQGGVINRNYPYNRVNIKLDIPYIEDENTNAKSNNNTNSYEQVTQLSDNEIEVDDEYEDEYEEYDDNFDDVDC